MSEKITAAGGYCAPAEGMYDMSEEERHPFVELLMAQLEHSAPQAVRGGITFQCGTSVTNMPKERDA